MHVPKLYEFTPVTMTMMFIPSQGFIAIQNLVFSRSSPPILMHLNILLPHMLFGMLIFFRRINIQEREPYSDGLTTIYSQEKRKSLELGCVYSTTEG